MRWRTLALLFAAGAVAASGCARAHAKVAPEIPGLDVPAPPPRDVEPTESEPPPPMGLPQEPARTALRPRPTPPARPEPSRPADPPKVEQPPTEQSIPPEEVAKPVEEPKPPPTLQTTPPNAEGEVERTVRLTLAKASSDLSRINYQALNEEARTQYDTARNFIRQADSAIRTRNLVFAKSFAEKAAALAAQLSGK